MKRIRISAIVFFLVVFIVIDVWAVVFVYRAAAKTFIAPYMVTYRGPTISISGKVIFQDYQSGPICIIARRTPRRVLLADIAKEEILSPGQYRIEVPACLDRVYLVAINSDDLLKAFKFPCAFAHGSYVKNPIRLKSDAPLKGIDIFISQPKTRCQPK